MSGGRAGEMLGANLRARREEQAISLSELSRRSGIAKGTLSQLESGSGNPTIETVFSLSNALGVPVSALLSERTEPDVLVVRAGDVDVLRGDAIDLRMLRKLDPAGGLVELYEQQVRPGAIQKSAGHPGIEHHLVLSGRLRIGVHGRDLEAGPGDYVSFRAAGPHEYEALDGPVGSVLLLQYAAEQPGDLHGLHTT